MDDESAKRSLWDPEVSLKTSYTYWDEKKDPNQESAKPLRILIAKPDGSEPKHFIIDMKETRKNYEPWTVYEKEYDPTKVLGKRFYFDEQVTHASQLVAENGQGFVVLINFQQPRIALLKDDKFKDAFVSNAVVQ